MEKAWDRWGWVEFDNYRWQLFLQVLFSNRHNNEDFPQNAEFNLFAPFIQGVNCCSNFSVHQQQCDAFFNETMQLSGPSLEGTSSSAIATDTRPKVVYRTIYMKPL